MLLPMGVEHIRLSSRSRRWAIVEPSRRSHKPPNGKLMLTLRDACPMTTVANLLARKQLLLDRLQEDPDPKERDEIERVLAQIETALNLLDKPGSADHDL